MCCVALGAWCTFSVPRFPLLCLSQGGLKPSSAGFPGPRRPPGPAPLPAWRLRPGLRARAAHLDNPPTRGTKAHCLGPRWQGSGRGAAAFHPTRLWSAGTEEQFTEAPAPAWAPGQAASWAGTLVKLGQLLPCAGPQFPWLRKGKQNSSSQEDRVCCLAQPP